MKFKKEPVGQHFELRKGLSYKGANLVDESEVGLLTIDAFITGGGYKRGSEKPYDGDYRIEHVAEPGDVLLAMTEQQEGLLASPLKVPEDLGGMGELVFSLDVAKVIATSRAVVPEFLFNFLRVPINRRRAAYGDTGTTVQRLPYDFVYEQMIPVPSLQEQDEINSLVALFDRRIDLCFDTAEILGQLAINCHRDVLEKCLEAGQTSETISLGDICQNIRRNVPVSTIKSTDKYIGLDLMPRATPVLSRWSSPDDVASSKSAFEEGEILFGKLRPYFRKAGVALTSGICSTDILVLKPKESRWFADVLSTVTSQRFVDYVTQGSSGTRMPRTSWSVMSEYEIQVPDVGRAAELSDFARDCFRSATSLVSQARTLREIQASYMERLISGQIRLISKVETV